MIRSGEFVLLLLSLLLFGVLLASVGIVQLVCLLVMLCLCCLILYVVELSSLVLLLQLFWIL